MRSLIFAATLFLASSSALFAANIKTPNCGVISDQVRCEDQASGGTAAQIEAPNLRFTAHQSATTFAQALSQALKDCRRLRKQQRQGESLGDYLRRPNTPQYYRCVDVIMRKAVGHDPVARMKWQGSKSQNSY